MKVTIEGGGLVIRLPPHNPPLPSAGGKTPAVASTRGNRRAETVVNGQLVTAGVNANIPQATR